MFSRLFRWVLSHFECFTITNEKGEAYMRRYYLLKWPLRIRLHEILRSDEDRDMHDHPYDFTSVILSGGYYEKIMMSRARLDHILLSTANHPDVCGCGPCRFLSSPPYTTIKVRFPGNIRRVKAEDIHQVKLNTSGTGLGFEGTPIPAWTLIFAGKNRREWGFHTPDGWVHWKKYMDYKHGQNGLQTRLAEKEMD